LPHRRRPAVIRGHRRLENIAAAREWPGTAERLAAAIARSHRARRPAVIRESLRAARVAIGGDPEPAAVAPPLDIAPKAAPAARM